MLSFPTRENRGIFVLRLSRRNSRCIEEAAGLLSTIEGEHANAAPHMTRGLSLVLLFHARNNIFRTPLLIFRPLPVVPDFRKHPSKGGVKGTFFQVFPREGKPCVVANAIIGIRATFFSSREYFSAAQLLSDHPDKMYQKKGNVVLPYSVSMLPKNLQVTRRQNILF